MRIVMMGTGTFAEPTLQALLASPHHVVGLVTQPDHVIGHVRGSTRQTGQGMKPLALAREIPIYQPASINTPEGVAQLQQWQPDLLVVAAYGQILAHDVLAVAPQGGINVHASLLPKYRGAAPVAWAIYHGETHTGVTIIRMSIHLDAGDMLAQESLAITPLETAGELEARLAPLGARLALAVIDQIRVGPVQGQKQDKTQVTKAPKLTKEHGAIDWTRAAPSVCRQIRAMQPWPTAYTFLHRAGQLPLRLLIHRAQEWAGATGPTPPRGSGQLQVVAAQVLVGTGQTGAVELLELQPASKRRMTAAEFVRGHPLPPGTHLGPESV